MCTLPVGRPAPSAHVDEDSAYRISFDRFACRGKVIDATHQRGGTRSERRAQRPRTSNSIFYSVASGVISSVMTIVAIRMVDRVGRRVLPLVSLTGMLVALVCWGWRSRWGT